MSLWCSSGLCYYPYLSASGHEHRSKGDRTMFYKKQISVLLGLIILCCNPIYAQTNSLIGHWRLDGDFTDATANYPLNPINELSSIFSISDYVVIENNQVYGPTAIATENGAISDGLTMIDNHTGITLSGWFKIESNGTHGTLFGFGTGAWNSPTLRVYLSWGYVRAHFGNAIVQYNQYSLDTWHHIAFVVPQLLVSGEHIKLYVDGIEQEPTQMWRTLGDNTVPAALDQKIFGSAFRIGEFTGYDAGTSSVDEIKLFDTSLTTNEIVALSTPGQPSTIEPTEAPTPEPSEVELAQLALEQAESELVEAQLTATQAETDFTTAQITVDQATAEQTTATQAAMDADADVLIKQTVVELTETTLTTGITALTQAETNVVTSEDDVAAKQLAVLQSQEALVSAENTAMLAANDVVVQQAALDVAIEDLSTSEQTALLTSEVVTSKQLVLAQATDALTAAELSLQQANDAVVSKLLIVQEAQEILAIAEEAVQDTEPESLIAHWSLDGNLNDSRGTYSLTATNDVNTAFTADDYIFAENNSTYGPTNSTTENGAQTTQLTSIADHIGITLSGWYKITNNGTHGTLFGFGNVATGKSNLAVNLSWGFVRVSFGKAIVQYERYSIDTWHHVVVLVPVNVDEGTPIKLYVDGVEQTPSKMWRTIDSTTPGILNPQLFGEPFRIAELTGDGSATAFVDEVRLYGEVLAVEDIAALAAPGKTTGIEEPPVEEPPVEEPPVEEPPVEEPPPPEGDLVGHWSLNGDFNDSTGTYPLTSVNEATSMFSASNYIFLENNSAYGPTFSESNNGAVSTSLTSVSINSGITLSGWIIINSNDVHGTLFGFGNGSYGSPNLNVSMSWADLRVYLGNAIIQYNRPSLDRWHNVILIIPQNVAAGEPVKLFFDGTEQTPTRMWRTLEDSTIPAAINPNLFGAPFTIGALTGVGARNARIDEVKLYTNTISSEEVVILATHEGEQEGEVIPQDPTLARFKDVDTSTYIEADPVTGEEAITNAIMNLKVRILSDNTVAVIPDTVKWIEEQWILHSGSYLTNMEVATVMDWKYVADYKYSFAETIIKYRPLLLNALTTPTHWIVNKTGEASQAPLKTSIWPQTLREKELYAFPIAEGEVKTNPRTSVRTDSVEIAYFNYLELPFKMVNGQSYQVADKWGNTVEFTYNDMTTQSWAIKVNQVGYMPDAQEKYAYLGGWLGTGGAMDLSAYSGQMFYVRNEANGVVVLQGTIEPRFEDAKFASSNKDLIPLTGEGMVYQLDFSALTTPGSYYIHVPGIGRSWAFEMKESSMGEAFYTHARGLYHQRCAPIASQYSNWPRGDIHKTYQGNWPPADEDYSNQGTWGFKDANGDYTKVNRFKTISSTATDTLLPEVVGGWHDAADYDRRPQHFRIVRELVGAYLMFPGKFTDGQLNIPESGNGIPDILDEATFGIEVWRKAQKDDGRVSDGIEATSHPGDQSWDPGKDEQRYYLGAATRPSSLRYARAASLLAHALIKAGAVEQGHLYLDSAIRAYQFAVTSSPVELSLAVDGQNVTWTGPSDSESYYQILLLHARIALRLATEDQFFYDELSIPEMDTMWKYEVNNIHWLNITADIIPVALKAELFPLNWGNIVVNRLTEVSNDWISWQNQQQYRQMWYTYDHGYFLHMSWGNRGWRHIDYLVATWRLTGDEKYRTQALLAVDNMLGANAQGRVTTTGLGQHRTSALLSLPSWADNIDEPIPGITIYGMIGSMGRTCAKRTFGLLYDPSPDLNFDGSAISQMPPPFTGPSTEYNDIRDAAAAITPMYRRMFTIEHHEVAMNEYTAWETISPAAFITGALMKPGWMPSDELKNRQPLTKEEIQEHMLYQP